MRRDWATLGRRLCDVLSRCEATGDFGPYVAALRSVGLATDREIEDVTGGNLPEEVAAAEAEPRPEKVADFTHRGPGL